MRQPSSRRKDLGDRRALSRLCLRMAVELEPEDAIEAMLITQMGVTHTTMMAASQRAVLGFRCFRTPIIDHKRT